MTPEESAALVKAHLAEVLNPEIIDKGEWTGGNMPAQLLRPML
jgi:hypothetical protein